MQSTYNNPRGNHNIRCAFITCSCSSIWRSQEIIRISFASIQDLITFYSLTCVAIKSFTVLVTTTARSISLRFQRSSLILTSDDELNHGRCRFQGVPLHETLHQALKKMLHITTGECKHWPVCLVYQQRVRNRLSCLATIKKKDSFACQGCLCCIPSKNFVFGFDTFLAFTALTQDVTFDQICRILSLTDTFSSYLSLQNFRGKRAHFVTLVQSSLNSGWVSLQPFQA